MFERVFRERSGGRNEHGREGCLSVFLGRDLAKVRRGYDVLLIFQQDSSRGLFGWTERQSVQRWAYLLQTKSDAFICIYISCVLTFWDRVYCKSYSTAGWLSSPPLLVNFGARPHRALQRTCTFIGTHTHTHMRAHTYAALGPIADPHTLLAKQCLIRWTVLQGLTLYRTEAKSQIMCYGSVHWKLHRQSFW